MMKLMHWHWQRHWHWHAIHLCSLQLVMNILDDIYHSVDPLDLDLDCEDVIGMMMETGMMMMIVIDHNMKMNAIENLLSF